MRNPPNFHGFIGQSQTVRFLRKQIQGAKAHGEPCPHLLFVGASGMGKICLAKAVTKEYGSNHRIVHGKASPRNISEQLVDLEKGDVVFCDEAHNLLRESQEVFYQIIDGGLKGAALKDYLAGEGGGKRDKDGRLIIQPVTVILATDQPGKLLDALRKRMEHVVPLVTYSEVELRTIASNLASHLQILVSPQALRAIASASQGQPRRAENHLKALRRHWHQCVLKSKQLAGGHVRKYLEASGQDASGLDARQRKYIEHLYQLENASLDRLASLVGSDTEDVEAYVEVGLIKLDFVRVERTGRHLTKEGEKWWREQLAARKARRASKQGGQAEQGGDPCAP